MSGAGDIEMLARQATAELQAIRSAIHHAETRELVAKGIHFGKLTLTDKGLSDVSKVERLPQLSMLTREPTIRRAW